MRDHVARIILRFFCLGLALLGSSAQGQQAGIYLSYSWDQPSGDFYGYAEATGDYASDYYYGYCAEIGLWQTPGSFSNSSENCSNTDAVVNWYDCLNIARNPRH
jgi:hypothetical protein